MCWYCRFEMFDAMIAASRRLSLKVTSFRRSRDRLRLRESAKIWETSAWPVPCQRTGDAIRWRSYTGRTVFQRSQSEPHRGHRVGCGGGANLLSLPSMSGSPVNSHPVAMPSEEMRPSCGDNEASANLKV